MAENQTGEKQESMTNKEESQAAENMAETDAAASQEQPEAASQEAEQTPEDALKAQLEEALQQVEQHKDMALRAQAELHNVRRRAERDVEQAHKFGLEKIAKELLPVVDNLERALAAAGKDDDFVKALREGVELTLNMFLKVLSSFNVEQVDPQGEPFDPTLHQAVSMVEQDEVEPNTVVSVMQKGYTLHGRIVRPAMVVVSKAASQGSPKIDEQA